MGIKDLFKKRENNNNNNGNNNDLTPQTTPQVSDVLLQALIDGETITREKAMTLPAVAGAVDFISNMIASMPVKLYRRKQGKIEEVADDPRVELLNGDTGDTLNAFELKKSMVEDYLLDKGGYAYIRKYKNDVTGLFYVKPIDISIVNNLHPIFKDYTIIVWGAEYRPYEFIRLLRKTQNGSEGIGITDELSKALQTAYQTLLYQLGLVSAGGNKKGFLKSQRKLGQDEIDLLKQAWRNLYGNNTENVVVLNNGLEFQEASATSVEMQLNESKKTLMEEINNIFHIQDDFYETFKQAIYPIVKAFATALNTSLLLEKEKGKYFFDLDVKEIIKANVKERMEALKMAKEIGLKTINEMRQEENLNSIEGLDVINVGLGAVLYDTNTHNYYTPNTDTVADPADGTSGVEDPNQTDANIQKVITDKVIDTEFEESGNSSAREERFNPNHDGKTGRFAPGNGSGGSSNSSGSSSEGSSSNGGDNSKSGGNSTGEKVNSETEKVKERLSNKLNPIEKKSADVNEVKSRGGLSNDEASKCIDVAESVYAKASSKEPQISKDVISSVDSAGGKMYGLDYRLKQPSSMAGKIGQDAKVDGLSFDEAGANIKDAVRYTAVIDEGNFTNGYNAIKKSMENKGYTEVRCKNYYQMYKDGTSCQKAVQSVYQDKDGYKFEFQFHTPSSQGAKELNHPLYEEQRKNTTSQKRQTDLTNQMRDIGSHVNDPKGVYTIKSHS